MRPQPRFAVLASAVRRAMREIERGGRLIEVLAPEDWSDARTEAWLDWAAEPHDLPTGMASETVSFGLSVLGGRISEWAGRLAVWGRATGVFAGAADARTFAEELTASLLMGLAAPARGLQDGVRLPASIGAPPVATVLDLDEASDLRALTKQRSTPAGPRNWRSPPPRPPPGPYPPSPTPSTAARGGAAIVAIPPGTPPSPAPPWPHAGPGRAISTSCAPSTASASSGDFPPTPVERIVAVAERQTWSPPMPPPVRRAGRP
jgi:hypothetical protein